MGKRPLERERRNSPARGKTKRIKKTVGKEELRHFKVILNPIILTPAENKDRIEQLYELIFS